MSSVSTSINQRSSQFKRNPNYNAGGANGNPSILEVHEDEIAAANDQGKKESGLSIYKPNKRTTISD
jgi:hypothetical protein